MYMLDTNAFSALMKQHPKFLKRFDKEELKNMCISSLAWAEVRYGVRKNIVDSQQNHAALLRLAVLFILSSARCLACFCCEPTITRRNGYKSAIN